MKIAILALALVFVAHASFAASTPAPIDRNDHYMGAFSLTPRVDGKFDFRIVALIGQGVDGPQTGYPDLVVPACPTRSKV